ncbi:MAG: TOBE domain-containing protein [Thermoplasmata archaeon]|nr:TOBE domain-containing protein [Thermoplasmata archaeon]
MSEERWLTPTDVRLLGSLAETPNLVRAARSIGIGRDRAVYRLQRLARLYGHAVSVAHRGGTTPGATRLTALGRRLLQRAGGTDPEVQQWSGVYRTGPPPRVVLGPGKELVVSFPAGEGRAVRVAVEPEAFVIARQRVDLSARNVLRVRVVAAHRRPHGEAEVLADWSGTPVRVALTWSSVERLRLTPGARVYLYVKAVALRRIAAAVPARTTRGSPRS